MDAIELLKDDHRLVDSLFSRIENTTPSKYPPIVKQIKGALDTHAHIEEKLFYPRLLKEGKKDLVDIVREGLEEHKQMKKVLRKVAALTAKNDQYEAKVKVLIENTRHHVKEEENEMFPLVRDQFDAEMRENMGERMQAEKEKYQKANGIKTPQQQKGAVTRLVEAAGEFVSKIMTADGDTKKTSKTGRGRSKQSGASSKKTTSAAKSKTGNGAKSGSKRKTGNSKSSKAKTGSGSRESAKSRVESSSKTRRSKSSGRSRANA